MGLGRVLRLVGAHKGKYVNFGQRNPRTAWAGQRAR